MYDAGVRRSKERIMSIMMLGIDLGKSRCSVVSLGTSGSVAIRRRMRRDGAITLAAKLGQYTFDGLASNVVNCDR